MHVKTYALYNGTLFEAGLLSNHSVVLRSHEAVDPSLGFEFYKGIVYIKIVDKCEVTEIFNEYSVSKKPLFRSMLSHVSRLN